MNSGRDADRPGLAIVATHPVQYYAPWFRYLAGHLALPLRVFYLDDPDTRDGVDPEFGTAVRWDLPLRVGYDSVMIANRSRRSGRTSASEWSDIRRPPRAVRWPGPRVRSGGRPA